jgi:5'-nucleotidase / UDP-sugar diphosphatase
MKRLPICSSALLALPIMLATATLAGCSSDEPAAEQPTSPLAVLFTSDEHSHMLASSPELDDYPPATAAGSGALTGGVARRATLLATERARAAGRSAPTLTLSAGDNDMGALTQVAFSEQGLDFQLLSELGYDATTLGNHEFDFGPAALAEAITAANDAGKLPPIVVSNIHFDPTSPADDTLAALYSDDVMDHAPMHPYQVLLGANGLKVGLVGFVGANAAFVAPNKAPVRFSGQTDEQEADTAAVLPLLYADVQPIVDHLRQVEKVDLVIALGHSGMGDDTSEAGTLAAEDYNICANVAGIDLIVSGHSHRTDAAPIVVAQNGGGSCVVLNAGYNGFQLGRIDYTLTPGSGSAPSWDPATQTLLPVDDSLVPNATMAAGLAAHIAAIEAAGGTPSYLEGLASRVEGATVTDDPGAAGDLYFRKLGHTSFDVNDEMLVTYLSADAMLAATDQLAIPTDMALESGGPIRATLRKGKTGDIALCDAYDVVPLGSSPLDGSLGYPLIRANLAAVELRAVFEFGARLGPTNSDYRLGQAGVRVTFDQTRPAAESLADLFDDAKGWVMKMELDTDHSDGFEQYDTVIYDRASSFETPNRLSVVTSSYIGEFASSVGITLKGDDGYAITVPQAVLLRPDQSEVKELEAFMGFLEAMPGGELDSRYDAASPDKTVRTLCVAGCN